MQRVKHYDLPHPFSIYLGPEEALSSAVKVEFSVERIPYISDPKVSCYESNGCIVFEGYCPIDTQNPFSQSGIRNTKTGSKQQQASAWCKESGETQAPYNPFVLWDVIPRLIQDIIKGPSVKVMNMDDKKLSRGSSMRDAPEIPGGSGFQKDSDSEVDSSKQWDEIQNVDEMREQRTSERDRPTMLFPLISGLGNSSGSADELSITNDPFEKRQWQTVGNIVEPNTTVVTPVITDVIGTRSSEALMDAADLVTERKWDRRPAHPGSLRPTVVPRHATPKSAVSKDDRVSVVLSTYTKSVPLQRRREEDTEAVSVSISETDSGEIEVDLSDADVMASREWSVSHADAACGTGRIDREASHCVLCGSFLHHRKERRDQRRHSGTGQPPRAMKDASTHTSTTEHIQRPKEKNIRRESITYPVKNDQGETPNASTDVSTLVSTARDTHHSKAQTITAYPVVTGQDQPSRATTFPPVHVSVTEYDEKHSRQETTEHPDRTSQSRSVRATINAGSSTVEETEKPRRSHSEKPKILVDDQSVAVYPMTRKSSYTLKKSFRANKEDDKKQCTMQHVLFPRETCPYTASLTSLPLDESDIEYIIQRAQLAKASLPVDASLCPTERWQHRGHHQRRSTSSRSRSRSSGQA